MSIRIAAAEKKKRVLSYEYTIGSTNDLSFIVRPSNHMSRVSHASILTIVVIDSREAKMDKRNRIGTRFIHGILSNKFDHQRLGDQQEILLCDQT